MINLYRTSKQSTVVLDVTVGRYIMQTKQMWRDPERLSKRQTYHVTQSGARWTQWTHPDEEFVPVLGNLKEHFRVDAAALRGTLHRQARVLQHGVALLLAL